MLSSTIVVTIIHGGLIVMLAAFVLCVFVHQLYLTGALFLSLMLAIILFNLLTFTTIYVEYLCFLLQLTI